MEFEDKHSYAASGYFVCPNESTKDWYEMLKGTPIYRAAGICSSGEVGFFGMLPIVRRKLVLIDHSYTSLNVAMSKFCILNAKGPKETYRLFTTAEHQEVHDVIAGVQNQLPVSVKNHVGQYERPWFAGSKINKETYNPRTGYYDPVADGVFHSYAVWEIQNHWNQHITPAQVVKAYNKLHLVKFIHGDLADLEEDGPYGLLYLSNALEHNNRDRRRPQFEALKKYLRPGGYVFNSGRGGLHGYDYIAQDNTGAVEVKTTRKCGTLGWTQQMYKVNPQPVAA
jgi:hypothetical protein